ncbi:hypothetical protein WICPIJ_005426 [Wickerhamomyces pijperi]|uniref:Uncharacterized protein n=1 Tax=Wickerhamomyces pijperi TaxID=599730 RepID=A0A9P8Q683_WICPI|nr:hypothetical protein WICPIJ_005426 [Wickerhamomyces pijperi]
MQMSSNEWQLINPNHQIRNPTICGLITNPLAYNSRSGNRDHRWNDILHSTRQFKHDNNHRNGEMGDPTKSRSSPEEGIDPWVDTCTEAWFLATVSELQLQQLDKYPYSSTKGSTTSHGGDKYTCWYSRPISEDCEEHTKNRCYQ